jgi:hypothetical protein
MSREQQDRERVREDRWGLRTERASSAMSRFCLAWVDAARDLGFGGAHLALRTAEDLSEAACPSPRELAARPEPRSTQSVRTVEVRRR